MNEQTTAVSLMRMALALLDRDGRGPAARHLEQAIDMTLGECNDEHRNDEIATADVSHKSSL